MICNFAPMILLEWGTTMRKGLTIAALTLIRPPRWPIPAFPAMCTILPTISRSRSAASTSSWRWSRSASSPWRPGARSNSRIEAHRQHAGDVERLASRPVRDLMAA